MVRTSPYVLIHSGGPAYVILNLSKCNYSFTVMALTSLKRPQPVEARLTFATTSTVPAEAVKKMMSFAN